MRPLVVETRHRPSHAPTSTPPETVRRSASATTGTRIEPLCDVMPTVPKWPFSSTLPDRVPMMTSAPAGHRTCTEFDARSGRISNVPSAVVTAAPPRSTTTSGRASAVTLTPPETALMRKRTRASAGGSTMIRILASESPVVAVTRDKVAAQGPMGSSITLVGTKASTCRRRPRQHGLSEPVDTR